MSPEKPAQHYEQSTTFTSPWLQFEQSSWPKLEGDATCDVAIVGGGISGVMTLYYLLSQTDKNVALFEQGKIAGQATGNNAGLACVHIERPVQELVEEFGLEKTRQSFLEIDASWDLMLSILDTIGARDLLLPLPNISLAITSVDVLLEHIEREKYNREFGRTRWHYYIVDDLEITPDNVEMHRISKAKLLQKLKIVDEDFIAIAVPQDDNLKIGRLNSAELSHRLLNFLLKHYPERLSIYENTPIQCIQESDNLLLTHPNGKISANDVVLCTNGYKGFEIRTQSGKIDRLHKALTPREGYMAGYHDTCTPYAQAFFDDRGKYPDSPYFYISHIQEFTILGGPEFEQPNGIHTPQLIAERAHTSQEIYKKFLKNTYDIQCPFSHFWYGIMGYTSNGVRWVGEEPALKHLWYNLGCNGIGITTSIGAAKRLVALMQGQKLPSSIFDIQPIAL